MKHQKRRAGRTFDYLCGTALIAVFIFAMVYVVLAVKTGSITAVKPKGSIGSRDILIENQSDPVKFWGNILIYSFIGMLALGGGCFVIYRKKNENGA